MPNTEQRDRAELTRAEKRIADCGITPKRIEEITILINSATPEEQATEGFKALLDVWNLWQSDAGDLERYDVAAPKPVTPPGPSRFVRTFSKP